MRVAVIQGSSRRDRNEALFRCTTQAIERGGQGHEVLNLGVTAAEDVACSYAETAAAACLLLSSGAVDFIVTGCSSGQGMMLAMNSLPGVLCGFAKDPRDAFLFGRINGGNAISLPLGQNFGYLGEDNLRRTLESLFDGEFGCGWPPEEAERRRREAAQVRDLAALSKRPLPEVLAAMDPALLRRALGRGSVRDCLMTYGRDTELLARLRPYLS